MDIAIMELNKDLNQIKNVQTFLFKQIKKEFGYGYVPEYHKDIKNMMDYYINPSRNNFFIAVNKKTDDIIGCIGIRAYDKNFSEFKGKYSNDSTASIWRLFIDDEYRRCGLATLLYSICENFCYKKDFKEIYLHTHKTLDGALNFWLKMGFKITIDTNNELQTVHMDKKISEIMINNPLAMYKYAIKL